MMAGVPIRTGERVGRFYVYRILDKRGSVWEYCRQQDGLAVGYGPCWWLHRIEDEDGDFVYSNPIEILTGRGLL